MWGSWSLFLRTAERAGPVAPALEAFVALGVAFACTAPLALRDRPAARRPARAWLAMAWIGVGDALNALLFFAAMQRTTIAVAVLTHYLAPVLVAIAAPRVLGERVGRATWAALGLALGGLALLLEPWRSAARAGWEGAALGAASAVFYAANVVVAKRAGRWFAPVEILAWHIPVSLAILAAFVPGAGWSVAPRAVAIVAAGGALAAGLAGLLFYAGLARAPAGRAAILCLLEPLVAVIVAGAAWGEIPSPVAALGGVAILAGAWLAARDTGDRGG